jgi:integrase
VTQHEAPTLPFSDEELGRLYSKLPEFVKTRQARARGPEADHLDRFPVLLLVMEFSGLRIGDAVGLRKSDLVGDKLWIDTQKTGTKVYIPLPQHVVAEMKRLKLNQGRYYFWSGNGAVSTAAGNYRRTLRALAAVAKVEDAHPHRFRDTLAVRLLTEGVPLERVAKILGHRSIRVTERSYSPWVKELQDTLEADVRRVWAREGRPKLVRVK